MDTKLDAANICQGVPEPYGVFQTEEGVNFSLHAKHAESVKLCLFYFDSGEPFAEIPLDPSVNRTGDSWHICVKGLPERLAYGYRISKDRGRTIKKFYHPETIVLDPYANAVNTSNQWGKEEGNYNPLGLVIPKHEFDWEEDRPLDTPLNELVIYEMHVRAFTQHSSSGVQNPGKYLGLLEKIPHLKELGVNAVKLMPIHEFNEMEFNRYNPLTGERLVNFWGYSTVNFFSPMNRYCVSDDFGASLFEFKTMVKELHKAGIEVILDVVFNHTAEGNEMGPVISFKGIDCPVYYILDQKHQMQNLSGCGNTVNCNHPVVREFIITCLRYWVVEMHVDGFRFDLAAIMRRGTRGEPMDNPPLIEQISHDPILSKTKLFAEPWDLGMYILGGFHSEEDRWSEWNDKYRETVRGFIKGDMGVKREFAIRICGSDDLFGERSPTSSINFITAHDGFTLRDLVSYNDKHNTANGEDNRDGNPYTCSWNCGVEGETEDADVLALRQKQMRNFHLTLMISLGVPMLTMGNEYGHTRRGNNNAWCQDNDLNWFLWDEIEKNGDFFRFYKELIHFRKRHPAFHSSNFYTTDHVKWHSQKPNEPDWDGDTKLIAVTVEEEERKFYIAFNTHMNEVTVEMPAAPDEQQWHLIVNTANPPPEDFFSEDAAPLFEGESCTLQANSAVLLMSK